MGLKEQLIVMKYSLKNTAINPVIRSKSGIAYIVLMAVGFTALLASLILSPNPNASEGTPISHDLRAFLITHGLNRFIIADIASATLMSLTTLAFILTPPNVPVREAEYELVLTQPIEIRDFVVGKALVSVVQQFIFLPYLLSMLVFASFLAPNPAKAMLATLSLILITTYFALLDAATNVVALVLAKRGLRRVFRVACLAYLIAGLVHTALLRWPSLILTVPLKPLANALIYSLAISPSITEAVTWLALSIIPITVAFLLIPTLADVVDVEDLKPIALPGAARREGEARKRGREAYLLKGLDTSSPDKAVMSVIYYSAILSTNHLKAVAAAVGVPAAICLVVRYFLPAWVAGVTGFALSFFIPLMTAIMLTSLLNVVIVNDLMTYWIYRVYLMRMKPVATALLLKIATYTLEAVAVMAASIAALTLNPFNLLLIPVTAPAVVLTSFAALALITYFASKRKVVKQAPSGMYVMESSIVFIVELFFIATLMGASALTQVLAAINATALLITASVAVATAATLTLGLREALTKLMERYDIAT